jgi:hypothetical protein
VEPVASEPQAALTVNATASAARTKRGDIRADVFIRNRCCG